jgi:hypothetical protein
MNVGKVAIAALGCGNAHIAVTRTLDGAMQLLSTAQPLLELTTPLGSPDDPIGASPFLRNALLRLSRRNDHRRRHVGRHALVVGRILRRMLVIRRIGACGQTEREGGGTDKGKNDTRHSAPGLASIEKSIGDVN